MSLFQTIEDQYLTDTTDTTASEMRAAPDSGMVAHLHMCDDCETLIPVDMTWCDACTATKPDWFWRDMASNRAEAAYDAAQDARVDAAVARWKDRE